MGKGPQESRFDTAVQGLNEYDVLFAATEWRSGQDRLKKVAAALRAAAPKMHEDFGGETGATAMVAFEKVGAAAETRAQEMGEVADALDRTKAAMTDAKTAHTAMGSPPAAPTPFTATGGNDADDLRREQAANRQKNAYDATMADRETKSQAETDKLEAAYREAMGAMKKAHGEPDQNTGGGGGGGTGGGAGGGAGGGSASAGGGGGGGSHFVPTHDAVFIPAHGDDDSTGSSGSDGSDGTNGTGGSGTPTQSVPAATTTGSAQGGGTTPSTGPTTASPIGGIPTSTSSGGIGAPAAGGVVGAIGGGMAGGMAGISGAVRGGGMTAVPTGATSAGAGGRTIGSSARAGTSGALGRSSVAGTAGGTGSPTTRAGGARGAAAGARGSAGGARGAAAGGAGQAGSRGRAGARGAGAGAAGAAGGKGRTKDKKGTKKDEFFEEVQDWIDDEGIAPGVID